MQLSKNIKKEFYWWRWEQWEIPHFEVECIREFSAVHLGFWRMRINRKFDSAVHVLAVVFEVLMEF